MASEISGAGVEMRAEGNMAVISADQLMEASKKSSELTNTFTLKAGNAAVDAALAAANAVKAIQDAKGTIDSSKNGANEAAAAAQGALAGAALAQAGAQLVDATAKLAGSSATGGFYASVSMETKGIEETGTTKTKTTVGSTIVAREGNATLKAKRQRKRGRTDLAIKRGQR